MHDLGFICKAKDQPEEKIEARTHPGLGLLRSVMGRIKVSEGFV